MTPLKIKLHVERKQSATTTITLTRDDVIAMLNATTPDLNVPTSANVTFCVPGGADWSNMELDINGDTPVTVRYVVEQVAVSPLEEIKTTSSLTTPWVRNEMERRRVSEVDNDDAKLDLVARALALDSDTASLERVENAFHALMKRMHEAARRGREAST